jgi:glycosyltransferase involved in cell wall biosynthesis
MRRAFERAGGVVSELHDDRPGLVRRNVALILRGRRGTCDVVIAPYPGYSSVPAGWVVARLRRAPFVLDAYLSLYETRVLDRAEVPRRSLRALAYRIVELVACHAADVVVIDTELDADYLAQRTHRDRRAFQVVPVAVDEEEAVFAPPPKPGRAMVALYYGNYIPLHGTEVIVGAAAELARQGSAVEFELIGDGPARTAVEDALSRAGLANVRLIEPMPYASLLEHLRSADVCLGVFGASPKTARVIPNKVVDALAAGRPVVTADTPAVRARLGHGEGVVLVPPADPLALAAALTQLAADPREREELGRRGRIAFEREFSVGAVAASLGWLRALVGD